MKNFVITILSLTLIICFSTLCFAEDNISTPYASELIIDVYIFFNISDNKANATANINGTDVCDKIGIYSFKIQEYRNGSWVTIASRTTQYNTNARSYSITLTSSKITEGNQYRATVTGFATDGSITDTRSKTSATKTA